MEERCHSTSAPAQNVSPSPASTTDARIANVAKASVSSWMSSASNALRRPGRARSHPQHRPPALDDEARSPESA